MVLFPLFFLFNSRREYNSIKTNSSTFETEGREQFNPVGRAGRGTSLCRAMASPLLKKGLDIFKEQNIHQLQSDCKNVLQTL